MRHIHVELARKEPAVELPAQDGDLPLPSAQSESPESEIRRVVSRPFGEEEIRLQKVYQLSILSQRGGFGENQETLRPIRVGMKRSLEGTSVPVTHKRLFQQDEDDDDESDGKVLCGSGVEPLFSNLLLEHRDSEIPRSPPLSPSHLLIPGRRPAQHNHDRPIPDAFAPLSPKSPPMVDPQGPHCTWGHCEGSPPTLTPRTEASTAGNVLAGSSEGPRDECHNSVDVKVMLCTTESWAPVPFSTPAEAVEWRETFESSPPPSEMKTSSSSSSSSNGLSSLEKTPVEANGLTSGSSNSCPVKKRLLSSSDTGESCSEDEGPSTSKRSRLAMLAPGLGLASCRSTDAKGAPFWNHLLPSAREHTKTATGSGRRLKVGSRLKSRQLRSGRRTDTSRSCSSISSLSSISRPLLGNFEESILKGRFTPSGQIEGFTAEIGASGSYCPQHATLPVQVTYYDTSEHSAPSPFLGVILLEPLGKKGYSVPKAGTIQVTLFNPNKTVVKMFLVTYNFGDMPVNHMTFLRHRIFLVPVDEAEGSREGQEGSLSDRKKILCYLIHLRFQSSKSGKIYLHNDIRLLFSRKSIEVDAGIPYELKSFTEVPRNPKYSPRV
ncbi:protein FAM214B-like isoform X1 [Sinocyclocheilus rhinocerous]|uniref:Atos homolog protein B n=1 Tax=Sinocyclocheilus rhinocerous TaxID=307959 RepID=A0A673HG44_9TELE|nr:PREDICTED: protein FAM214B-like isoform X1 [Sinocyclocheilus rhinocerous]XP_016409426.1 PREDICTED: protein FAM214B-like isoform X1 [Sinocyclocheilus rhinocerous]XP_016409428.1 PREDICTED: protein FAM214B-like isoform X1 [Sinocyclocheilus rhinocerous]XP_016409429.1 PREDICTED: protein FAM214B-like isoform X1 [Sinocyclocheilus rhinocerous]XP_016409430.1 PREDICTED: protein FAM214B-like isoform X1 [Sinocyclocheilus rhinocerous]XP_016409431.1 PREDICTED: protein FAM214B-like isoform X1 [Sinocycloch